MNKSVCVYFQVHQPNRLKPYSFFDIGIEHFYEDDELNLEILNKVCDKCYLPANRLFTSLLNEYQGEFKLTYSISGVLLKNLQIHRPDVLESFVELYNTGCVELLSETYYHSLASIYDEDEFYIQVQKHQEIIFEIFGAKPTTFRNTELIYSNEIANLVAPLGYKSILTEGIEPYLFKRTPNQIFTDPEQSISVLVKNHILSDDIAFRFSHETLTSQFFVSKLKKEKGNVFNLFMDYETIGEHQWQETGIFNFWKKLPLFLKKSGFNSATPRELTHDLNSAIYDVKNTISWADSERDLSAWNGNPMQFEAIDKLYKIKNGILKSSNFGLIEVWRRLQTSDHFYYMSTKNQSDGDVHAYFSPYNTPYDAYIYFMNVLSDIEVQLKSEGIKVW